MQAPELRSTPVQSFLRKNELMSLTILVPCRPRHALNRRTQTRSARICRLGPSRWSYRVHSTSTIFVKQISVHLLIALFSSICGLQLPAAETPPNEQTQPPAASP